MMFICEYSLLLCFLDLELSFVSVMTYFALENIRSDQVLDCSYDLAWIYREALCQSNLQSVCLLSLNYIIKTTIYASHLTLY